jgi:hypothetical protein
MFAGYISGAAFITQRPASLNQCPTSTAKLKYTPGSIGFIMLCFKKSVSTQGM